MGRPLGTYVSVYLSQPLFDHLESRAHQHNMGLPVWIREQLIELCPEDVQAAATALLKNGRKPKPAAGETDPARPGRPPDPPPPSQAASFEELVERHRERVLELEARGFLENQIAGIAKVPFKVVQHILTSKAAPKKGGRK